MNKYWELTFFTKVFNFSLKYFTKENAEAAYKTILQVAIDDVDNRNSANHEFEDDFGGVILFCPVSINGAKIEEKYDHDKKVDKIRDLQIEQLKYEVRRLIKLSRGDSWAEGDNDDL